MITQALFSSNTDEWATPQSFFDELNKEFGFTLDPCSTDENAKCELHYTIDNDGLTQNWGGGKEYFATLRMVEKSRIGSRSVTWNLGNQTLSLCCLFLREQTLRISTTTSIRKHEKLDLYEGGCTSMRANKGLPSQVWL